MSMIGGLPPRRPDQEYRPTAPPGPVGGAAGILRARDVIVGAASGPQVVIDSTLNYTAAFLAGTATDVASVSNIRAAIKFPSNNANELSPSLIAEVLVTYTNGHVADGLLTLSGFTTGAIAFGSFSLHISATTAEPAAVIQGLYTFAGSAVTLSTGAFEDQFGLRLHTGYALWAAVPGDTSLVPAKETWHAVAFVNGWVNTAGRTAAQYRLVASPPVTAEIIGGVTAPAGIVANQTVFTVPAAYRPADTQSILGANVSTGGFVRFSMDATGALNFQTGAVAGNIIDYHSLISLDA